MSFGACEGLLFFIFCSLLLSKQLYHVEWNVHTGLNWNWNSKTLQAGSCKSNLRNYFRKKCIEAYKYWDVLYLYCPTLTFRCNELEISRKSMYPWTIGLDELHAWATTNRMCSWLFVPVSSYLVVVLFLSNSFGEAKVTDLCIVLCDQQHIPGSKVPVDEVMLLQVLHTHRHLVDQFCNVL